MAKMEHRVLMYLTRVSPVLTVLPECDTLVTIDEPVLIHGSVIIVGFCECPPSVPGPILGPVITSP